MNWWPEAFPRRAAFAAVGLASRDYFPGKHGVLFLNACWQCGALQQPGGYPQVDHHQLEQPDSMPGAPQPQFDNEAELALVAQVQRLSGIQLV
ncbi:hypothetical protein QJQ45_020549 [Haematococcus lacustris]|nr:hypothetical protein QJQ45_020549 [Haematococcus lacustris]